MRGLALVAAAPAKRGLEELLFEFFEGFVETNLLFEHFSNEGFQPLFQVVGREIPVWNLYRRERSLGQPHFCRGGRGKAGIASTGLPKASPRT